jgi:lysophospholipase
LAIDLRVNALFWIRPNVGSNHKKMEKSNMSKARFNYLSIHDSLKLRYGHWQSEHTTCRGTVVVLGGRAEFAEKYQETIQDLLGRGFDAFSMDWRGQGMSGRLLEDAARGYVETYDHYVGDLDHFLEKIVYKKGRPPFIVMAHSMGGNIVLQLLNQSPRHIERAVLLAPMVDIRTDPFPAAFARWCSELSVKMGMGQANIPALQRYDTYHRPFRSNWLTHDCARFNHIRKLLKQNSQLAVSTITFGWLAATYEAIDRVHQPGFLKSIATPTLLVVAGQDRVVSNSAVRYIDRLLPSSRIVTIGGAYHEILQEQDPLRDQFWQEFDRFAIC